MTASKKTPQNDAPQNDVPDNDVIDQENQNAQTETSSSEDAQNEASDSETINSPNDRPTDSEEKDTSSEASQTPNEETDPIQILEAKLAEAEKKATESYDRLLRATAEFENYKKRSTRDMAEFRKFANESLIKQLLTVVDNLERALDSSQKSGDAQNGVAEGIDLTLKEILKILSNFNVKSVNAKGEKFDPAFHQAVVQEETDEHPEGTVLNELQKGYLYHERLIRPSMVIVAKKKTAPADDSPPETEASQKEEHAEMNTAEENQNKNTTDSNN